MLMKIAIADLMVADFWTKLGLSKIKFSMLISDTSVSTRLDPSLACSAPHTDHIVICRLENPVDNVDCGAEKDSNSIGSGESL